MLYHRWKEIVRAQPGHWAVRTAHRQWTFAELDDEAQSPRFGEQPILFPTGAQCIPALLAGWRTGRPVCPLEPGQPVPKLPVPPPEIVHLKSTSATTGMARWVAFTAAQLRADVDQIVATMGLSAAWPNIGAISLVHSYGFSNLVLPLLLHGIPLVLLESPLPEALKTVLATGEAWTVAGVPALWRAWHTAGVVSPRIRLAISAGAPLSRELEQSLFTEAGIKLHNFYGATECGGIAYDRSETPRADGREAGTALEGVRLDVGAGGCLEVRGPAVGHGYWPEPADSLAQGCYQTSDLAEFRSGRLLLLGRATDQINVAGRKVFPEQIEGVLRTHPAVADCLVFGVSQEHGDRSEAIVACVVARSAQKAELQRHLAGQLPGWQMPRHWWFVTRLEPNHRGKLSRAEYRRRFLENQKR